ncbi:uncharacterized protein LOC127653882 isoform X2 [Xyrauchen texanus]|uniref:uncharacterized protein LOC127653882 isoform X2 n=1 Tax=Xyrauchen texanus TaxID=154827 RepID=UPI0022421F05|nr:uncharacterized protein LOC127653882 isoform X2 [Xyrauchen texanus]
MHHVVRYSLLLINFCFRSPSSATMLKDTVTVLKEAAGKEITIPCATDESPQNGVYMYKQDETEKKLLFYFYKGGNFTLKNLAMGKVILNGTLPNLNATFLNLTGSDIGLYWCEFNFEDKIKHSCATWLYVTETTVEKECPENPENYYMMILLIGCVIIFLLCLITFFCVILKVGTNIVEYLGEAEISKPFPFILGLRDNSQCHQSFVVVGRQALQ